MRNRIAGAGATGFLIAFLTALPLTFGDATPPGDKPAGLPTVVRSGMSDAEKAAKNLAKLALPLEIRFKASKEGWQYKGACRSEGDGPLGKMRTVMNTRLVIPAAAKWPTQATLEIRITKAAMLGPDGKWLEQDPKHLPPSIRLPPVAMDRMGRSPGNYNPGEAPLSFMADLWPLPRKPLDIGDRYVERVAPEKGKYDPFRLEGTRQIILLGTKMVGETPCAEFSVKTNLDAHPVDPADKSATKVKVLSHVVLDLEAGRPLEAKQQVEWSGKVDEGQGRVRDFKWQMTWDLKRAGKADFAAAVGVKGIGAFRPAQDSLPTSGDLELAENEGFSIEVPSGETLYAWAQKPHGFLANLLDPTESGLDIIFGPAYNLPRHTTKEWNFHQGSVLHGTDGLTYHFHTTDYKIAVAVSRRSRPKLRVSYKVVKQRYWTSEQQKARLIERLNSREPNVRRQAIRAIIAETALGAKQWGNATEIKALMQPFFEDPDPEMRKQARWCVALTGDEETMLWMMSQSADERLRGVAGGRFIGSRCYRKSSQKIIDRALAMLKSEDESEREFAVGFFFDHPYPPAKEGLLAALKDPSPTVRRYAIRGAARAAPKEVTPHLVRLFDDPDVKVQCEALLLARDFNNRMPTAAIVTKLKASNPKIREYAAGALDCCGDPKVIPPLLEATKDAVARVRAQAAVTLGRIQARQAYDRLVEMLSDESKDVRYKAANGLRWMRDKRAIAHMKKLLETEQDPQVRNMATRTIRELSS